jgi:hypothetical protein
MGMCANARAYLLNSLHESNRLPLSIMSCFYLNAMCRDYLTERAHQS